MRKIFSVTNIEKIEKDLKDTGLAWLAHDGGKLFFKNTDGVEVFPGVKKTNQSKTFIRIYEVYTDPKAKAMLVNRSLFNLLDLLAMYQGIIKLVFDYRNGKGELHIADIDAPKLLSRHKFLLKYMAKEACDESVQEEIECEREREATGEGPSTGVQMA